MLEEIMENPFMIHIVKHSVQLLICAGLSHIGKRIDNPPIQAVGDLGGLINVFSFLSKL